MVPCIIVTLALAAGDFALAAKIGWTLVRIEWTKAVNKLKELWAELKFAVLETWADFAATISDSMSKRQGLIEGVKRLLLFTQRIVNPADIVESCSFATTVSDSLIDRQGLVKEVERLPFLA